MTSQLLPSWYVERPEGCLAQPTLHEHAEKHNLTCTGTEAAHIVWVKNKDDKEFAMCCYYKIGFCEYIIVKPDKRGNIVKEFCRHVHEFSTCGVCGSCVPLPIRKRKSSRIEPSKCFQCLEHTKVIETQASDLKLQEEALMLDFHRRGETQESVLKIREEALMLEHLLQGEALRRKWDELRLQQKSLDKATKDHKKAQEEQVKNIATSFQGKRTNRFSLCYTNNKY
jgi:hypothetical protein